MTSCVEGNQLPQTRPPFSQIYNYSTLLLQVNYQLKHNYILSFLHSLSSGQIYIFPSIYIIGTDIDKLLKSIGRSLAQFKQLPQPPPTYLQTGLNNLVIEETSYNLEEMKGEFEKLFAHCNPEQLQIFNTVIESMQSNSGGVFFVYGSGG